MKELRPNDLCMSALTGEDLTPLITVCSEVSQTAEPRLKTVCNREIIFFRATNEENDDYGKL